jgi:hypothetical protein
MPWQADRCCRRCENQWLAGSRGRRRPGEVRVLTWNLNSFNANRHADKVALLASARLGRCAPPGGEAQPRALLPDEKWLGSFDDNGWPSGIVEAVDLADIEGRGRNGCVVLVKEGVDLIDAELLPIDTAADIAGPDDALPQAERALAARVRVDGNAFTAVSFHAPHAAGRSDDETVWRVARKVRSYVRLVRWVRERPGPVVVGLDANS